MQLVDTNVLVYAYDSSSDKHQQCKQIVAGMLERREERCCRFSKSHRVLFRNHHQGTKTSIHKLC
jgi:hypothetical protein